MDTWEPVWSGARTTPDGLANVHRLDDNLIGIIDAMDSSSEALSVTLPYTMDDRPDGDISALLGAADAPTQQRQVTHLYILRLTSMTLTSVLIPTRSKIPSRPRYLPIKDICSVGERLALTGRFLDTVRTLILEREQKYKEAGIRVDQIFLLQALTARFRSFTHVRACTKAGSIVCLKSVYVDSNWFSPQIKG